MADYPTWREVEDMIDKKQRDECTHIFAKPAKSWAVITICITILAMFGTATAFLVGADRDNRELISLEKQINTYQTEQIIELRRELFQAREDTRAMMRDLIKELKEIKSELRQR